MSTPADSGADLPRCSWASGAPEFPQYHDTEWGFPVGEDRRLFEKLCLESFQAGLSWRTILTKRENFRAAFAGFQISTVAGMTADDVARLLTDAGIIRHRGKIEAVINNARRAEELIAQQGSLAAFVWSFEPRPEELGEPQTMTTSPSAVAMAKELKSRGWKFLGPTTVFAFMQSMGLLNDHAWDCFTRPQVDQARAQFIRPSASS